MPCRCRLQTTPNRDNQRFQLIVMNASQRRAQITADIVERTGIDEAMRRHGPANGAALYIMTKDDFPANGDVFILERPRITLRIRLLPKL